MRLPLLIPVGFPPFFPAGIFFYLRFPKDFCFFSIFLYVRFRHFLSDEMQLFFIRFFAIGKPDKY